MEGFLQIGKLVKPIENFLRISLAGKLDNDSHSLLVRLVPDVFYAFDFLFLNQIGKLFNQG